MFEIETLGPCLVHKLEWEMGGGTFPPDPSPQWLRPWYILCHGSYGVMFVYITPYFLLKTHTYMQYWHRLYPNIGTAKFVLCLFWWKLLITFPSRERSCYEENSFPARFPPLKRPSPIRDNVLFENDRFANK